MRDFYIRNRFWISLLANLLFWLATCFFFARFSLLRPLFHNHIYEEFFCVALIALIVYSTRWLTIPYLFNRGRYGDFWMASAFLLLFSTTVEILLMKSNMQNSLSFNSSPYLLITYTLIFLRNSCFFAWFLVLDLYSSLKATFKKKQQVSVLEHQTVQFSLPDNIEASFPLNKILYIKRTDIPHNYIVLMMKYLLSPTRFRTAKRQFPPLSGLWKTATRWSFTSISLNTFNPSKSQKYRKLKLLLC